MILVIGGAFQGKYDFVKNELGVADDKILRGFHKQMREWLDTGKDPAELVQRIMKDDKFEVVISDEIGMGLVPIDRDERRWREETGRALCQLASRSSRVYRVHCGIPVRIKG